MEEESTVGAPMDEWARKTGREGEQIAARSQTGINKLQSEIQQRANQGISQVSTAARAEHLASILEEDKLVGLQALEDMNLPRLRRETVPLSEFLQNPTEYFSKLGSKKFYINLPPTVQGEERFREVDLSQDGVLQYIAEKIPAERRGNYNLVLSEDYDSAYAGNMVINPDGTIRVEMVKGRHGPLVSGRKTPEIVISRDTNSKSLKYTQAVVENDPNGEKQVTGYTDLQDESLKRLIADTILTVPHEGDFDTSSPQSYNFKPGYYEFFFAKQGDNAPLKPIFLDYRSNPAYQTSSQ